MLKIYTILSYLLVPIIIINLYLRIYKNKEDSKRYFERLGKSNIRFKKSKKVIWLHAASVGEFKSSDLIIKKYHKNFHILVTTTTKTSAEYVKKYYNDKVVHQYIPFDVPMWCSRFVGYWKPSLILWIESDIWPNMLKIIKDNDINCFYINARVSPKSYKKWKFLKNLYSSSLSTFNEIFVQSPNDLSRIKELCNQELKYIGNLKLYNDNVNTVDQNIEKIFSVMIVSSHETEEDKIIKNIKDIIINNKLKICIAPRHPDRTREISKLLEKYNFSYSLDSEEKNNDYDVTIVDNFGKLDTYFSKSHIVILGGSFVNKGGHNPLEPAKHGCAILSGKFVYNWQNIYDEMANENACIIIKDTSELNDKIINLIFNKNIIEEFKKKALDFSNKKFFDNEKLFYKINLVLN